MRNPSSKMPIAAYEIAPYPPKEVAAEKASFDALGDEWGRLRGELDDAKEAAVQAKRNAVRDGADAYKAGKEPPDVAKIVREYEEKIDALGGRLNALSVAVDEQGNALAASIAANGDAWVALLRQQRDEGAARYDAAIADAKRALADFAPLDRACEWVAGFEAGPATVGRVFQFTGGRVQIPNDVMRGGEALDPRKLLEQAARATAPVVAPQARSSREAGVGAA